LKASLTYIPSTSSLVQTSAEIDALNLADFNIGANGVIAENSAIFLSDLYVPTQNFTLGFSDENGNALKDVNGETLIQFFSLHADSNLMLNTGQAAGNYQIAVLSDDGSNVYVGSPLSQIINDDGTHSNTLGCSSMTVSLIPGVELPLHVDYYQGPKVSIGLILLWRPIPAGAGSSALSDPACGRDEGDTYYFNEGTPDVASSNWIALLSRGWEVIPAANYYLPHGIVNPCTEPSPSPSPSMSASPSPSPSASPHPSPSASPSASPHPSVSPSPAPSPSPSPTGNGGSCGGGDDDDDSTLVECEMGYSNQKISSAGGGSDLVEQSGNSSSDRLCMSSHACLDLINSYAVMRGCTLNPGEPTTTSAKGQCTSAFPGSKGTCKNASVFSDREIEDVLSGMAK
jgi:hypothetical protein